MAEDGSRRGQMNLPGRSAPELWCHDQEGPLTGFALLKLHGRDTQSKASKNDHCGQAGS